MTKGWSVTINQEGQNLEITNLGHSRHVRIRYGKATPILLTEDEFIELVRKLESYADAMVEKTMDREKTTIAYEEHEEEEEKENE